MEFLAAKCTSCGEELRLPSNKTQVKCMFCGVDLIVQEALVKEKSSISNLLKVALMAEESGNSQEAYDYYTKVLELEPDNFTAHLGKGVNAGRLSSREFFRGIELLNGAERAVNLYPNGDKKSFKEEVANKIYSICLGQPDFEFSIHSEEVIKCLEFAHNCNPQNTAVILSLIQNIRRLMDHERKQIANCEEQISSLKEDSQYSGRNLILSFQEYIKTHQNNINDYQALTNEYISRLKTIAPEKAAPYLKLVKHRNNAKLKGENQVSSSSILRMDDSIDELVNRELREENKFKLKIVAFVGIAICSFAFLMHYAFSSKSKETNSKLSVSSSESFSSSYPYNSKSNSSSGTEYKRTTKGYDSNAPVLPRDKDDIEPLYNEVQRLKEQQGLTDEEVVRKILKEKGEIP